MITKIKHAIANSISQELGDSYNIYTDKIEQGLQEPCFFIRCITPTIQIKMGNRRTVTLDFVVTYFPKDKDNAVDECDEMHTKLCLMLDMISDTNGDSYKAKSMYSSYDVDEQKLDFYITYSFDVLYVTDKEQNMEDLDYKGDLK